MQRKTVLYLDQNAWIALAQGAWDKTAHPREHAALGVVGEALTAGHLVVPLSFANQYETMKINDPVRRQHLAHVQVTISEGRVLRSRRTLLHTMLLQQISQSAALSTPQLAHDWFLSDLWFETVGEPNGDGSDPMVPASLVALIRKHPKETLFEYLVGDDEAVRKEAVRRFSEGSATLLSQMARRRKHVAGETFAMRLRAYGAQLMIEEIDYILALGRQYGLAWSTVSDIGSALARSFVDEVPIMEVERQLAVRLEDQKRATTENDLRDMAAFTAALPLVDLLVGERQFVNLSRQAKLDGRYGTVLLTSVHDLTADLLGPREAPTERT